MSTKWRLLLQFQRQFFEFFPLFTLSCNFSNFPHFFSFFLWGNGKFPHFYKVFPTIFLLKLFSHISFLKVYLFKKKILRFSPKFYCNIQRFSEFSSISSSFFFGKFNIFLKFQVFSLLFPSIFNFLKRFRFKLFLKIFNFLWLHLDFFDFV